MSDSFNSYLNQIDSNVWRDICVRMGELRHYSKGEDFVTIGHIGKYIGYIVAGTLKYVAYSDDGSEHVMGLVFDNGLVADWPFALYGKKAKLSIVAASDCDIYCVTTQAINDLMETDPQFKDIVMHATEAVYTTVYDRYVELYCKSPQQRYEELLYLHPDLFNMFSLKDIASFLNITPTHLSRLKKNDKN